MTLTFNNRVRSNFGSDEEVKQEFQKIADSTDDSLLKRAPDSTEINVFVRVWWHSSPEESEEHITVTLEPKEDGWDSRISVTYHIFKNGSYDLFPGQPGQRDISELGVAPETRKKTAKLRRDLMVAKLPGASGVPAAPGAVAAPGTPLELVATCIVAHTAAAASSPSSSSSSIAAPAKPAPKPGVYRAPGGGWRK